MKVMYRIESVSPLAWFTPLPDVDCVVRRVPPTLSMLSVSLNPFSSVPLLLTLTIWSKLGLKITATSSEVTVIPPEVTFVRLMGTVNMVPGEA